jgi:hypothetical protein
MRNSDCRKAGEEGDKSFMVGGEVKREGLSKYTSESCV